MCPPFAARSPLSPLPPSHSSPSSAWTAPMGWGLAAPAGTSRGSSATPAWTGSGAASATLTAPATATGPAPVTMGSACATATRSRGTSPGPRAGSARKGTCRPPARASTWTSRSTRGARHRRCRCRPCSPSSTATGGRACCLPATARSWCTRHRPPTLRTHPSNITLRSAPSLPLPHPLPPSLPPSFLPPQVHRWQTLFGKGT